MIAPPPNLSLREDQTITRWRAEQQDDLVVSDGQPSSTCRCGAWLRRDLVDCTRCSRSEARINRRGEPVGGFICDGQADPGDRILLLATICGAGHIIVGLVRSWGGEIPWIAGCELCEWRPSKPEDADLDTLMGHLRARHDIPDKVIQRVGPLSSLRTKSRAA